MGLTTAPKVQVQYPLSMRINDSETFVGTSMRVRERAVRVCVRVCVFMSVCARLHCMQVASLKKMIVLRHSLCPHDVGG